MRLFFKAVFFSFVFCFSTGTVFADPRDMKGSKDRADAVMKALVAKYGVASSHLQARGVAQLVPMAFNQTEKGRALNRRVELVAQ